MSGVELKPCGVSSGDNILVPLGSTTVGRGPFLGISDKRVSRNHAILDIKDGIFRVKPIHVNPTYFSKTGDSKLKPLKKDEWKELENGNRISLTPNEHIFEVMIDDRPVQSLTQSPRSSIGTASPVKTFKDSPLKSQTEDKEEEDAPSPACRKLDFHADNNDSTAEEETNDGQEEVKKSLSNEKDDGDEEDSTPLGEEDEMDVKPPSEDNKKYAKPVDRNRELPAWMLNLPSGQEEEPQKEQPKVAKKAKAAPKASSRAKKRPANEISDEEEEEEVKPPAKKRGAPARTPRKKTATLYKEDEEEDEEDEAPVPELKKRTSSRGRQTTRVSYVDDVEVDDDEGDEEFVAARDDEEEEESDWEEASSPKKGKGKGKGKSPRGAKAKKRRGRRSTYSDEESSEEDVYIPKPTKRTAKILSDSQRSTDSETTNSRRRRNRSDDKENGDETRKPCPYGSKCYRKNPRHNKDFSHPDDDDYNSESEIVEPEEDDKAECPYGLNCYRTNLEHKKQFKHPLSSDRPQRQTRRGRGKAAENGSDEDAPDTYDYEDSFLDDKEEEEEDTPQTKTSEDSDWDPGSQENSEDVSQLVKEAKGYIKNKKMQKPI